MCKGARAREDTVLPLGFVYPSSGPVRGMELLEANRRRRMMSGSPTVKWMLRGGWKETILPSFLGFEEVFVRLDD
jgi:hypothetical protein